MENKFKLLKEKLAEVIDLNCACAILDWDQQVFMPAGSAQTRADTMSTLAKVSHEKFVSDEIGGLIDELTPWAESKGYDSDEAAMLRVARRDYEKEKKLPADLVAEFSKTASMAINVWQEAKAKSDFSIFKPHLEKIFELCKRKGEAWGYTENIYDPFIDIFEPGMKKSEVKRVYDELKKGVLPIYQKILQNQNKANSDLLKLDYDDKKQFEFVSELIKLIGFDTSRGRQDKSVHPFCTGFSRDDVRLTTKTPKNWLPASLYGSIHECGHAIYEQGLDPKYYRTILAGGASHGMHESQSRMLENMVGRSRQFTTWMLPKLQKYFPEQLGKVSAEQFYKAINTSGPSLIRIEADEVTYNFHTLLRFEIESAVFDNEIKVADIPALWNEKMKSYVGITPPNDAKGALQDVHWSNGLVGYFPSYTLGNIIAAQLMKKATAEVPGIYDGVAKGDFTPLIGWLRKNIHQYGRKYTTNELVKKVTGGPINAAPMLEYLQKKYSEIYGF
ncbi:MAG: carboxypeptidase M32 [Elusimicrobia bacterium]|nr:carboxypeptidase M32 [Elusimicrobiota bacterium]